MNAMEPKKRTPEEEAERQTFVDSLCGKYAFTKTSSEEFMHRKQEEIELEERRFRERSN